MPLRVIFVCVVYPPESEPSAVMASELVREMVAAGHTVTVICPFPNRPMGAVYEGFSRRLWKWNLDGPGRVVRVWTWLVGRSRSTVNRVLEGISFGLSAAIGVLVTRRPDVVLMETWPIFGQVPVLVAARLRGLPVVNYIKDLYPEAAEAARLIRSGGRISRSVRAIDRWVQERSRRNIVISEGTRAHLMASRGIAAARLVVRRDWLDLSAIRPVEGKRHWRAEVGIGEGRFVCMFAGTLGHASGVGVLVEVAEILRHRADIVLVVIGEGIEKNRMRRDIELRGLSNLLMLPFQPRERVAEVQSSADVLMLTSTRDMGTSSVPSKLITYLAVGRPVLCAASREGELAKVVTEECLGVVAEPGDAASVAAGILSLKSMGVGMLSEMGRRARELAMARYSLDSAVLEFEAILVAATTRE